MWPSASGTVFSELSTSLLLVASTVPLYGCALLCIQRQVMGIWAACTSGLLWTFTYKSSCGCVLLLLGTFLGWGLLGLR